MTDEEYQLAMKQAWLSDAGAIIARIPPDDDIEKERLKQISAALNEWAEYVYANIVKARVERNPQDPGSSDQRSGIPSEEEEKEK